jgi:hypothetical protein
MLMDGFPLRAPRKAASAVAAALAMTGLGAGQAAAQQAPSPMQNLLSHAPPASRHYATPDGQVRFVFDRTGGRRAALVRFDGDPEVHVLRPTGGPGGDEIYRSESGDITLRVTPHGGLTVYTRTASSGVAASEEGVAEPLAPRAMAIAAYQARMRALQRMAAQGLGRSIAYEVPAAPRDIESGLLVDAAERITDGLVNVRNTRIQRVIIQVGRTPAWAVRGNVLIVQVAPDMGYAGRPSSRTIRNVALRAVQGPEQ